jgi:hypothetical protein
MHGSSTSINTHVDDRLQAHSLPVLLAEWLQLPQPLLNLCQTLLVPRQPLLSLQQLMQLQQQAATSTAAATCFAEETCIVYT